jgi:hypothetical protein
MRVPVYRRSIEQSGAGRPLLYALLGLVSSLLRLDSILDDGALRRADRLAPARGPAGNDEVLMALLGVIALRRTCGRHLSHLAFGNRGSQREPVEGSVTLSSPRAPQSHRSLLR